MVRALDKGVREWAPYKMVDQVVKNYLISVPLVADLKSPSMRDRHWQQLMEITKVKIVFTDTFALEDMLKLNLHNFVDDVGEVVDRATKEDKMEQTLAKLKETWATIEFVFDQHNNTDVYQIGRAHV